MVRIRRLRKAGVGNRYASRWFRGRIRYAGADEATSFGLVTGTGRMVVSRVRRGVLRVEDVLAFRGQHFKVVSIDPTPPFGVLETANCEDQSGKFPLAETIEIGGRPVDIQGGEVQV